MNINSDLGMDGLNRLPINISMINIHEVSHYHHHHMTSQVAQLFKVIVNPQMKILSFYFTKKKKSHPLVILFL